jgi:hypothetical protein
MRFSQTPEPFVVKKHPPLRQSCPVSAERFDHAPAATYLLFLLSASFDFFES